MLQFQSQNVCPRWSHSHLRLDQGWSLGTNQQLDDVSDDRKGMLCDSDGDEVHVNWWHRPALGNANTTTFSHGSPNSTTFVGQIFLWKKKKKRCQDRRPFLPSWLFTPYAIAVRPVKIWKLPQPQPNKTKKDCAIMHYEYPVQFSLMLFWGAKLLWNMKAPDYLV